MMNEIEELRKMLDYTMRRYNELLERVEKLEKQNNTITYCTSTREPIMCGTSVSGTSIYNNGRRIGDDGNLYINSL